MNKFTILALCVACLSLSACADGSLPSSAQIEANIPNALRKCPGIPNPPKSPTNRTTAKYITKLYGVAVACKRDNVAVADLLNQYDAEIRKYKGILAKEGK